MRVITQGSQDYGDLENLKSLGFTLGILLPSKVLSSRSESAKELSAWDPRVMVCYGRLLHLPENDAHEIDTMWTSQSLLFPNSTYDRLIFMKATIK